jgi:hypothetical protein
MSVDSKSYLEQCIAALPAEKREAARRAFCEISETGDDSYLSKLLAVLEANGAYAKRVPKEMTDAGAKVVRDMEDIASRLLGGEVRREASFKSTIAVETARLVDSLPVRQIASAVERQNQLLEQLRRAASELDRGISSGLAVLLLMLAFASGVALPVWLFWDTYQEARRGKAFFDAAAEAGIQMKIEPLESGTRFTVRGPSMGGVDLHYDDHNAPDGLAVDFGKPR